jgi:hypothetical protein
MTVAVALSVTTGLTGIFAGYDGAGGRAISPVLFMTTPTIGTEQQIRYQGPG